jgi:hypothetical protein
MQPCQNVRTRIALARSNVNTNLTTGNILDCKGYDSATFVVLAQSTTTSAVPGSLVFQHSDDGTNFDTFSTISTGLPTQIDTTAVSNQDTYADITVNLRGKRRYLRFGISNSVSSTAQVTAICLLDDPGQAPVNATASGSRFIADLP